MLVGVEQSGSGGGAGGGGGGALDGAMVAEGAAARASAQAGVRIVLELVSALKTLMPAAAQRVFRIMSDAFVDVPPFALMSAPGSTGSGQEGHVLRIAAKEAAEILGETVEPKPKGGALVPPPATAEGALASVPLLALALARGSVTDALRVADGLLRFGRDFRGSAAAALEGGAAVPG
jgi:hypothetical protein